MSGSVAKCGTLSYAVRGVRARNVDVVEAVHDPEGLLDSIDEVCRSADLVVSVRHDLPAADVCTVLRGLARVIEQRASAVELHPWGEA